MSEVGSGETGWYRIWEMAGCNGNGDVRFWYCGGLVEDRGCLFEYLLRAVVRGNRCGGAGSRYPFSFMRVRHSDSIHLSVRDLF